MPTVRRLAAVPAVLALACGFAFAAVRAPSADAEVRMKPLNPCYVSVNPATRETTVIYAEGFEPHAVVDVSIGPHKEPVDADANGVVKTKPLAVPYQHRGQSEFTVSLTERDNPGLTAMDTAKVTALSVRLRPRVAATSDRVRMHGRGFLLPKPIWAHYVFRGKVRKTVRLVRRPRGDCGRFSVRRRQIPIVRPHPGRWTLQVDQQRRYSEKPQSAFVPVRIDVHRVVGR